MILEEALEVCKTRGYERCYRKDHVFIVRLRLVMGRLGWLKLLSAP